MSREAFKEQRRNAEIHLIKQLRGYTSLKELPRSLYVLCPGAGLLPSLQSWKNILFEKGVRAFEIVCVDPCDISPEEFQDWHADDQFHHDAHQLSVKLIFIKQDIYTFMTHYDTRRQKQFDLVYYEHPLTLSIPLCASDSETKTC